MSHKKTKELLKKEFKLVREIAENAFEEYLQHRDFDDITGNDLVEIRVYIHEKIVANPEVSEIRQELYKIFTHTK